VANAASIIPVLWALMPVLSFRVLTPVPFAYAAIRLRDRRLWRITAAYVIPWVVLWLITIATQPNNSGPFTLLLVLAAVATGHAWLLRRRVFAPPPIDP
jgi:hypothetical protein